MTLTARVVDVPADALAVARALSREPGLFSLIATDGSSPSYVACRPVTSAHGLDPEPDLVPGAACGPLAAAPRWLGLLPYEARRELERPELLGGADRRDAPHHVAPVWYRYGAVVRVAEDVVVVGDDRAAVAHLAGLVRHGEPRGPVRVEARATEPDAAHEARIRRALSLILEGEIYQVNLARRFDFTVTGRAPDVLERLLGRARIPHAIAADVDGAAVVGGSPELFLEVTPDGRLRTVPIKGTRPRGADAAGDAALARELDLDPKERAELSMVVDVERNDLGRVARTGSVVVHGAPRVVPFGSVWHRLADVRARLRPGVGRGELLAAMLPSGSVTGAPKVRAMEVVAALESARRGLYTGAFGALAHDGGLRLGMAIRTLTRRGDETHYFAGGGIVHGSEPAREVVETHWKAAQLLRLLGAPGRARGA